MLHIAALLFLIAAYKVWKDEHDKYQTELARNSHPEIRGEYFGLESVCKENGEMVHWFHLSLCNLRPQATTIKYVILTLSDDSELNLGSRDVLMTLEPLGHLLKLEQGIEAIIKCTGTIRTLNRMFLISLTVRVVDAFGNSYTIPKRVFPCPQ